MSGIDERHTWFFGPHIPEASPHGFRHTATQLLFGIIGLALITFTAIQFHLQQVPPSTFIGPGTISLLYLIVVAYVSLRAGFVAAVAVSGLPTPPPQSGPAGTASSQTVSSSVRILVIYELGQAYAANSLVIVACRPNSSESAAEFGIERS
jgi:hypothetical protein